MTRKRIEAEMPAPGETWCLHFGGHDLPSPFGEGRRHVVIIEIGRKWISALYVPKLRIRRLHREHWIRLRPERIDTRVPRTIRAIKAKRAQFNRLGKYVPVKALREALAALEGGKS